MLLELSKKAPVILIDASYFVFYRYFATARWWSFQNRDSSNQNESALMSNNLFRDAFIKHADAEIDKLRKRWGLLTKGRGKKAQVDEAANNIIFCKDCSRASIWRMEIYKDYKASRQVNEKFDANAFGVCYESLCPDNRVESAPPALASYRSVCHPRLEADDVACLLFRQIRKKMGPEQPVVFITGDHDYLQLKDDHCDIYSLPDKNLWEAGQKKGTQDIVRKILMGDSSDNIPPVLSKKQIDTYMDMESTEERAAFLELQGKSGAFKLNKTLMCWSNIPQTYVDEFNDMWEVVAI